MGPADQLGETAGDGRLLADDTEELLIDAELLADFGLELVRPTHQTAAEAKPDHRITLGPVPALLGLQPGEEVAVAPEQLRQGVQEQGFTKAPGAGEEVVLTRRR